MADALKPPIIIFGNTRSGTTILQKLMATHPDLVAWYEPRTLWLYADPTRSHDEFDEGDATDRVKRYIRARFVKYQQRHGNRVVLEKTPANILKIPYVRAILPEAVCVFIVRNPFSFISSVELKWQRTLTRKGVRRRLETTPTSQLHHYAGRFIMQYVNRNVLRRKYQPLWGPRYRGIEQDVKAHDLLTVIARQWSKCSRKADEDLRLYGPDRILRLRYEDFVDDPISALERTCAHCGIEMAEDMVRVAGEWVDADRQDKWRRLDPRALARLVPELEDEMQRHGYEVPPEIAQFAVGSR